ncbi:hypothetical protein H6S82_04170 [Planktothrix sp. FACHB-1355]|uniref:Uncharacterized protein n=1 Tax=Aerosakkonema funiforme FACHB-1375 TaxID=2949571 RepID=A0A926ZJG5_9CYAN|nr:hypothetical protein [Aerosakkonema funiforme]MBD2182886.1 hypothetical protein [Aerosakkonema funiforme FACHB-1375]MBD3558054.1 hypothetical protein [Planktothrix sp. FACHB-1355]
MKALTFKGATAALTIPSAVKALGNTFRMIFKLPLMSALIGLPLAVLYRPRFQPQRTLAMLQKSIQFPRNDFQKTPDTGRS